MSTVIKTDLCIIGGGSGGLSTAAGAVQMGADVVLIEQGKMGGDCLNYGCVPSKSILAAGHAAYAAKHADQLGVQSQLSVDFKQVHAHVHKVIEGIAPHDSVERFTQLGVNVITETGHFVDSKTVAAGSHLIQARRFVISTGSSAVVPPISGIETVPYFTNETIFDLTEKPEHLLIIGGGPIGCELAQAFSQLGCLVTILQADTILSKDEPELVAELKEHLIDQGIHIVEHVQINQINAVAPESIQINYLHEGQSLSVTGSHLLVAAGRKANVDTLNLDAAHIEYTPRGIKVDARMRTSNKKVFAIGDVAGGYQFTHVAGYHAGIIIKNALFGLPSKANHRVVPWVTYTSPELGHVGLTETEAKATGEKYQVLTAPFAENDRARAELKTAGSIKVIVGAKGKILGASILGAHAGELLTPWILAMNKNLTIKDMAEIIAPYPTLSEINKRVAGSYYTDALFSAKTKRFIRFIQRWLP